MMLAHVPILDSRGRDAAVIDRPSQPLLDFSQKHQRIRYTSLRIASERGFRQLPGARDAVDGPCLYPICASTKATLSHRSIHPGTTKRTQTNPIKANRASAPEHGKFRNISLPKLLVENVSALRVIPKRASAGRMAPKLHEPIFVLVEHPHQPRLPTRPHLPTDILRRQF